MTTAQHGPIACRNCWKDCDGSVRHLHEGKWQLVNDPGYWGAPDPKVLILGMTKGTTQMQFMQDAHESGNFDAVAFSGFRPRLLQALQAIGLMQDVEDISPFLTAASTDYGFASIVRCSLTARDKHGIYRGNSAPVIRGMKSPEGQDVMARCIETHLSRLSDRTRLVVLLGNDTNYFAAVKGAMLKAFNEYQPLPGLGQVAFRAGGRLFVHIGHPSPLNGHFKSFLEGDATAGQGLKREQAKAGVALA